jgi:hypothetical protein
VAHLLEHNGIDMLLIGVTNGALAWDKTARGDVEGRSLNP